MKRILTSVSDETIEFLKADINALNIPFTIRKHKQKYANGGISVSAPSKINYRWSGEQLIKIASLLVDKYKMESLARYGCTDLSQNKANAEKLQMFYGSSISYLNIVKEVTP